MGVFEEAVIRDRNERNSLDKEEKANLEKFLKILYLQTNLQGKVSSKPAIFSVEALALPCPEASAFSCSEGVMIKFFQAKVRIDKSLRQLN